MSPRLEGSAYGQAGYTCRPDKAEASLKTGVLTVKLPKTEPAKGGHIIRLTDLPNFIYIYLIYLLDSGRTSPRRWVRSFVLRTRS